MEIKTINLKKFYLKKAIPYLLMAITLGLYGFPFKFPHNTFNWIQKYDLPEYTYPVFIILFILSFLLMIVSFFSTPSVNSKLLTIQEGIIHFKGTFYKVNNIIDFKLEAKHDLYIEKKTVYRLSVNFKEEKKSLHILLSHKQKKSFEDYLKNYSMKNNIK